MKIAIVYHSESGNTKLIAEIMEKEASQQEGVESKAMDINKLDEAFVNDSEVVIFGCPTYCGTMSWQMKKFMDTMKLDLSNKLGSVFATERYIGGGADFAELGMIGCMLVRGMIIYTGGAKQAPATHFGAVVIDKGDDPQVERAKAFVKKITSKASEIFS